MGKLEAIFKQFKCTTQTGNKTSEYTFSAIVKASYGHRFVMKVNSRIYEKGVLKGICDSSMFFDTFEEIEQEFKYHYALNKENLYTKKIEIII